MNFLITGSGGDIGQSIIKLLKNEYPSAKITGTDIHDKHPGKLLADKYYNISRVNDKNYITELLGIIEKESIDIVIPVSEIEIRYHAEKNIFNPVVEKGIPVITANTDSLLIGFDKLKTAEFLKQNNLPYPQTFNITQLPELGFPLILKSKTGSGSKSLHIVNNSEEFSFYSRHSADLIQQEFISADEGEYTCGLFRNGNDIRHIIYKRTLQGGYSNYGIKVSDKNISSLLDTVAEKLNLAGSINVQLRLRKNMPYIFEINPRFSSTILFRHLMGFKDLIWSIENSLKKGISPYSEVNDGAEFFKGFEEYVKLNIA